MPINIREPVVNGMFYPASKEKLSKMISSFLIESNPIPNDKKKLLGLIAPHAGYVYSGSCAAYAYKLLKSTQYDTIIILGPSHYTSLLGAAIWPKGFFKTPLGNVAIDEESSEELLKNKSIIETYEIAHMQEHSIEVQIPFLQYILKNDFKIIPLVIGNPTYDFSSQLADALYNLQNTVPNKYLFVASSDLSHYHTDNVARRMDIQVVKLIEKNDPELLTQIIDRGQGEACGIGPILTLLLLSKKFKDATVETLNYTNSGETSGDKSRVVGYLSSAIYI